MPRGYEKMRDAFIAEGMSRDKAQAKAARIWNDEHPKNPVTGKHKKHKKKKRKTGRTGRFLKALLGSKKKKKDA